MVCQLMSIVFSHILTAAHALPKPNQDRPVLERQGE